MSTTTKAHAAELPTVSFPTARAFSEWLADNHSSSRGIWLRLARKGSGTASITYGEAVEVALAWGWIDGQKQRGDDASWLQKFTPRGAKSVWSRINREKALRLIEADAMQPAGLAEVERAKQDGRWDVAYDPPSRATVPDDLQAALQKNPPAAVFFPDAGCKEQVRGAVAGADGDDGRDAPEANRAPRRHARTGREGASLMQVVDDQPISFDAIVERLAPEVPRFVVFPGTAWEETGTFTVDVSLNGVPIGLRNLIPWKERGWHFGLSEPICRKVGIDTGDHVRVEMRRLGDARPRELEELLQNDPRARTVWSALAEGERRDFVLFVAGAKKAETRMRRAARLLERRR